MCALSKGKMTRIKWNCAKSIQTKISPLVKLGQMDSTSSNKKLRHVFLDNWKRIQSNKYRNVFSLNTNNNDKKKSNT